MKIVSFSPFGYEGALVQVEVDLRRGIPAVDIVGLADGAVKESRERMRSAIRNSGFEFPPERVLISLSPADLKKEGAGFDLAIALAVLCEKQKISGEKEFFQDQTILVMGELELNGTVRPVRGIHAAAGTAFEQGIRYCIVPALNVEEAKEVEGITVYGAESLLQTFNALQSGEAFSKTESSCEEKKSEIPENCDVVEGVPFAHISSGFEFAEVKGQDFLVRGLQIAASGGHHLLAYGSPGCGKTMALQKFPALLPLLREKDAESVLRIYSIAGLRQPGKTTIRTAPFRQPHQTASIEGICGGGPRCTPGEISLSHNGTLFLDEAAEFRTSVLQMLRVPLESGAITLSRAGRSTTFPAQFQLLMATNPCPCGFFGSKDRICLCSGRAIEQYWKKFSGPLLDRIDIRIPVFYKNEAEITSSAKSTSELRKQIAIAQKIQFERQDKKNVFLNSEEIEKFCKAFCSSQALQLLQNAANRYSFSPRSQAGCLKLARTIADMQGKSEISEVDMAEAVSYRKESGGMELAFAG